MTTVLRKAILVALLAVVTACSRPAAQTSSATTARATPVVRTAAVTYTKDVAPILYEHCATCHRPIDDDPAKTSVVRSNAANDPICVAGAPFSVLDYASVKAHAIPIAGAVTRRAMPPWLPQGTHGAFLNERRLTDEQIAVIRTWVEEGAPEGRRADMPAMPQFAGGWQLGKPDLVVTIPDAYVLQPGARDVFRNFVIPVAVPSTKYVRAVEFRADNPRVLHHATIAIDPGRVSRRLDRAEAGPGFATMPDEDEVRSVYGWSPGKVPVLESPDTAWSLDPGTDLVVELHMIAGSKPVTVQPSIGLFFADRPPTRSPIAIKLESKSIDIPAGDPDYVIEDRYTLPADVDLLSVYPHAHYLAKQMRGTATLPDGSSTTLIWIPQWDFRWQDEYRYRTPLFLPKGTTLTMRFTYDNSTANRNNPRRVPEHVVWGPRSTDEMGALWLEVVPRRREDAGVLARDYTVRARRADIAAAEQQVTRHNTDPAARNLLAMKYLQAGRVPDAQAQLLEALRLDPRDAEAHSNLGTVLQAEGRLSEAIPHLREAVRLKPGDDRVHFNLGNGLLAAGQVEDAIAEFRAALSLNAENADAHFNLAMILGPRNQVDEAIDHLRRVVDIDPRRADAHRNLSVAYGLQGKLDAAIGEARAALRLDPGSAAARDQLDRLLAARGRSD